MHLNKLALVACFIALSSLLRAEPPAVPKTHVDHPGLQKLKWQQAVNASSFKKMTLYEMIDLLHALDVHHIELLPGQALSPEHKDVQINANLPADQIDALLAKLKGLRMDIVSYDAGALSNEDEARKIFEVGKKLKIKTVVCEASPDKLEMLDKLANEFSLNVALLGNPDELSKALEGRSKRVGLCADPAGWRKQGKSPLECAKTLAPRVLEVALVDTDASGKPVAVGSGA